MCIAVNNNLSYFLYGLLGETLLKKGLPPNPLPKTFNSFWRGVPVLPKNAKSRTFCTFPLPRVPLTKKRQKSLERSLRDNLSSERFPSVNHTEGRVNYRLQQYTESEFRKISAVRHRVRGIHSGMQRSRWDRTSPREHGTRM